jgi:hypothetical protein
MAKAYYDCAECGAVVTVVARSRKEAERHAKYRESQHAICDDCQRAAYAEQGAKAAIANSEAGLPELSGSPKQIAWAEQIRATALADIEVLCAIVDASARGLARDSAEVEAILSKSRMDIHTCAQMARGLKEICGGPERCAAFLSVLRAQTRASWWIDHRSPYYPAMAEELSAQISEALLLPHAQDEAEEAVSESYIMPEGEPASKIVAEVSLHANDVRVTFAEVNNDFRSAVKMLGYKWADGYWSKRLNSRTGDPIDRAAEVAHRIVSSGFIVSIHDETARQMAIDGCFKPEHRRWVTVHAGEKYKGWLAILWPKADNLYAAARSLPGSRYNDGKVVVPPGAIEAVLEFAERYDFSMTDDVRNILVAHRAALEHGAVVTDIKDVPTPVRPEISLVPPKLDVPDNVAIADDLMDEEASRG